MKLRVLTKIIIVIYLCCTRTSLDHEKSFLRQDTASNVIAVATYGESILVNVFSDVVERDIETGAVKRTFRAHQDTVNYFVITDDFRMITTSYDDYLIIWDLATGSILKRIPVRITGNYLQSISFVNEQVVGITDGTRVYQVDLTSGRLIRTIEMNSVLQFVVTKGEFLYVGKQASPQAVRLIVSIGFLDKEYFGHLDAVMTIFLHENLMFTGSFDKTIKSWDVETAQVLRTFVGHAAAVATVAVFNGELYSGGDAKEIIKWNMDDGSIIKRFQIVHDSVVTCLAFKSNYLFSGSGDSTVIRWDPESGTSLLTYLGKNTKIRALALWKFFFITGGENGDLKLWDASINSIDPLSTLAENLVTVNTLFVFENYLYSGGSDKILSQWNLTSFELVKKLEGPQTGIITAVADRFYAYAGSEEASIFQWNVVSGLQTGLFVGHSANVASIRFLDNVLYSGSSDRSIRAWNTETLESLLVINTGYFIRTILVKQASVSICGFNGIVMYSIPAGEIIAQSLETTACLSIANAPSRVFSGHTDSIIRSRDLDTLSVLETYQGHVDSVLSLVFDESSVLYSCSFDGSVKKWNMASRKVAFSFEDRNSSVSALAYIDSLLFVGLKDGKMLSYSIDDTVFAQESILHSKGISTLIASNGTLYSSGSDGTILKTSGSNISEYTVLYNSFGEPLHDLALSDTFISTIRNEISVILTPRNIGSGQIKVLNFQVPLICVTATNSDMIAGSKSGTIFMWSVKTLTLKSELKGHLSQVNDIQVDGSRMFSASSDKRIIEWSLEGQLVQKIYQRSSLAALGHLGPVNSLSLCADTLFSAGSDLTVRRWNTQTGRHEDVYFGFFKSVSVVLCSNETLFAGSEDFGVLMFKPQIPEQQRFTSTMSRLSSKARSRAIKKLRAIEPSSSQASKFESLMIIILVGVAAVILIGFSLVCLRRSKRKSTQQSITGSVSNSTSTITDINTVINSVIGISKHAAYLVESSAVARTRKIASGGGGELFLAKVMDPILRKRTTEIVIQKIVNVKSKLNEEAFFQEVGIMIMLASFPNFCQIIAYTESPLSMILRYYPDGSLHDWIKNYSLKINITVKFLREIATALNVMHSYYLAHCDLKPQNVLIEVQNGVPSCILTDFGIAQILSEKIIASRIFNVINLRGLSVYYASPEAFQTFRQKKFVRVDFKKYDAYSFACVLYELISQKTPWA